MSGGKEWRDGALAKALARFPLRKDEFLRSGGEPVADLYGPDDVPPEVGFPGEYPYTRGPQATMYRGRLWTMRQYAGFGTARESNARYRYLLEKGTTGLSVAFDLPTQMGLDSDDPMAAGEVGKVGVAIDTLEDMQELMAGIPVEKVSTSMTINATASVLLGLYLCVGQQQGADWSRMRGTIQNDVLKEYMARGTYIYPPKQSMRIITDIFEFCRDYVPRWNTISISGYHIREAGSTAAQEIAFTLADGIAYVDAAIAAGLDVDEFGPRLSFFFNAHNNLLEEIGKFRAARRMWARIMRERFGSRNPKAQMMRFHTQTAGSTLTAQQVDNNVVRVTLQALAAVMGGTQSLHTNGKDEALALPTEASARLALRTQQVIASESGVADFVDPLGGSWAVEKLTDELEESAMTLISRIDELGGMVSAIEQGFPQREIQNAAYRTQLAQDAGELEVVGVNLHREEEANTPEILRVSAEVEAGQIAKLQKFRTLRDQDTVLRQLDALSVAARGTDNLMPVIMDCLGAGASLGEISQGLAAVFGRYRENVFI